MFTDVAHSEVHNLRIGQFDVPGVVVLTGVSDAQTATATVTTDLYSSGIAEKWEIESFNEVDGYARAIGFEDNRLTFAGSTRYPIDKWYSETNNYTNFVAGTAQDQPFSISAIGFDSSPAQWLSSHDGAFMGTASAEATLTPQNIEQSVGPENLPVVRWFSNEGCAYLPPVFLNSRLFALQSSTERLSEYAYSIERGFNGGYDPSEATLLAEHMLAGGVRQLAIRRMPEKGIWCVLNNGTVAVFTHRPKAQLAGWWRIATNGAIKSVAIARGNGTEDSVYMAVLRGGVGYMEKMRQGNLTRRRNAEAAALADDTATVGANVSLLGYLDCASTHTGSGLTSISGLTRFAGAEVTYLADGMARTGEVSGAGVLTLESPSDVVQVGLPFDTIIEPRSIEAFSEFSTSVSRYKVAKTCILSIYLSAGGMVRDNSGSEWSLTPDQLAADNPLGGKLHKLATGQFRVDITGDAQRKKSIRITHSDPYPFTLLGLYTELEEHPL